MPVHLCPCGYRLEAESLPVATTCPGCGARIWGGAPEDPFRTVETSPRPGPKPAETGALERGREAADPAGTATPAHGDDPGPTAAMATAPEGYKILEEVGRG